MYLIPNVPEIKRRRENAGLSAYGLAVKAGLNEKAIYRIESNESKRTHNLRAAAISKALGCKTSDIFTEIKKDVKKVG